MMSESSTGSSRASQADDPSRPERDKDEFEAGPGYQPSTNQVRDEPLPASHHDDGGQEGVRRRGEPGHDDRARDGQDQNPQDQNPQDQNPQDQARHRPDQP